jgi:hypothetical protein
MNRKTVTYTSTLPNVVMEEVVEYAKKKKISKNKVIEIALKRLLEEEIKNELRESFKKIADDPEMLEMAEWGIEDYAEQLKKFDK